MTKRTTLVKTKFCSSVMAFFSIARVAVISQRVCLAAAIFSRSRGVVWRPANMTFSGVEDQSLGVRFDWRRFYFCCCILYYFAFLKHPHYVNQLSKMTLKLCAYVFGGITSIIFVAPSTAHIAWAWRLRATVKMVLKPRQAS